MAANFPPKHADEMLDYAFNWAARLGADTIASAVVTASGSVTKDRVANADGVVTFWLSGGTPQETCIITCEIVTAAGRTMEVVYPILIY